jgi:2-polyprenyl-3-methyl-5-hydroxy-6-metoxy-1,4-benzoquinol methylase
MDVGERMTPHNLFSDSVREEFALAMQRYRFCIEYAQNARVLDAGCGVGNGSFLLSGVATSVLAIDNNAEAIAFAKKYYPNTNLSFLVQDGEAPLNEQFSLIVSLDVLEHVQHPSLYLKALAQELQKGGALILSTPNKSVLQLLYSESNQFHLHEMGLDEFQKALRAIFTIEELFGQHLIKDGPIINTKLDNARTFIAVCTK